MNQNACLLRENTGTSGLMQTALDAAATLADHAIPQPLKVTETLHIVAPEDLASLKPDSWSESPHRRHKDKTDVIEMIVHRNLPRDLAVAQTARPLCPETWDALKAVS